jgi:hypothetical protein
MCRLQASGCRAWVTTAQCDLGGGERCDMGTCIPPCQNVCDNDSRQCTATNVRRCEVGPTGCTIWRDEPNCRAGTTCVEGNCFEPCGTDELETCAPAGTICTGLPQGKFCLPNTSGAGGGAGTMGGGSAAGGTADVGGGSAATGGGVSGAGGGGTSGVGGGSSSAGGSAAAGGRATGGSGAGSNTVGVEEPTGPGSDRIGAKAMGCGCSGADGLTPLLFGAVALLRRRRPAARREMQRRS